MIVIHVDVEDYIGEIDTMSWNRRYDVTIKENNDMLMEHVDNPYAAIILDVRNNS